MFSKKTARVKDLIIGGGSPVALQTMYDSQIASCDIEQVLHRLRLLKAMGCDLIRFSYVSSADRENFTKICRAGIMPVVADIHFDYRMALEALECGADKVRINPGNIGPKWKTEEVVHAAMASDAAIRIGLNSGSLPRAFEGQKKEDIMVNSALEYLDWFVSWGFDNTVISLKASDIETTIRANEKLRASCDVPIHLGITEAGGTVSSCIKSTYAFTRLFDRKIGDTIRVSITGSIEDEVHAGVEILRACGLRKGGVRIVSCPRCGRHSFDSQGFLKQVENRLLTVGKDITVAIMGCQVNGPGEAKNADVAITGIGRKVFLYYQGQLYKDVDIEHAESELFDLIGKL